MDQEPLFRSVDELAKRTLKPAVDQAFELVDINIDETGNDVITVEQLAAKTLSSKVSQAIPDIEFSARKIEAGIEVEEFQTASMKYKKFRMNLEGHEITFTLILAAIVLIIINS